MKVCVGVAVVAAVVMLPSRAWADAGPTPTPSHADLELANCRAQHRPECMTPTQAPTWTPVATPTAAPAPADTPTPAPSATPLPDLPMASFDQALPSYLRPSSQPDPDPFIELAVPTGRWDVRLDRNASDCAQLQPWSNVWLFWDGSQPYLGDEQVMQDPVTSPPCAVLQWIWHASEPCAIGDQGMCDVRADATYWASSVPKPCWKTDASGIVYDSSGRPEPCPPTPVDVVVAEAQATPEPSMPVPSSPQVIYITLPAPPPIVIHDAPMVVPQPPDTPTPFPTPTDTATPFPTPTSTATPVPPTPSPVPPTAAPTSVPTHVPPTAVPTEVAAPAPVVEAAAPPPPGPPRPWTPTPWPIASDEVLVPAPGDSVRASVLLLPLERQRDVPARPFIEWPVGYAEPPAAWSVAAGTRYANAWWTLEFDGAVQRLGPPYRRSASEGWLYAPVWFSPAPARRAPVLYVESKAWTGYSREPAPEGGAVWQATAGTYVEEGLE